MTWPPEKDRVELFGGWYWGHGGWLIAGMRYSPDTILSSAQVAQLRGISRSAVTALIRRGVMPATKVGPRCWHIEARHAVAVYPIVRRVRK